MYPSLITKTESQVIPVANGLVVDPATLRVIGVDTNYKVWTMYETDLEVLEGIDDKAFWGSKVEVVQLPASWGDTSRKWSSIGSNIFNGSSI